MYTFLVNLRAAMFSKKQNTLLHIEKINSPNRGKKVKIMEMLSTV